MTRESLIAKIRAWTPLPTFASKIAVLVLIFAAVPAILYEQFRAADAEKNELLLANVRQQGGIIAESLRPLLTTFGPRTSATINGHLANVVQKDEVSVKVLLRPSGKKGVEGFFFVGAWPSVSARYLSSERESLIATGVFDKLRDSCQGNVPLSLRYANPEGAEELIASLVPINVDAGCWVIVTSYRAESFLRSSLGRPYWRTPEVQFAAVIYLTMAVAVIWLFAGAWRNLRRFARLARRIGTSAAERDSFGGLNRIPELDGVAQEFDRMVGALRDSARLIRQTAEENSHALKAPVAVISQAVEPIKRGLPKDDRNARRAVSLIEQSIARLDGLVSAARRLDEATAEVIERGREPVDISRLLERMLDGYRTAWREGGLDLESRIEPGAVVSASPDMLEIVFENILENAAGFSSAGQSIRVSLTRAGDTVEARIDDEGPGVKPHRLTKIFDRYVSDRSTAPENGAGTDGTHFGIGLWVVRRNVEALGGTVDAENRDTGGLRIVVRLPVL